MKHKAHLHGRFQRPILHKTCVYVFNADIFYFYKMAHAEAKSD